MELARVAFAMRQDVLLTNGHTVWVTCGLVREMTLVNASESLLETEAVIRHP